MDLLKLDDVCKSFGGVTANENVSLAIREDEIVSLIGPNGAGKTTLFNVITGVYPPDSGTVFFGGHDITRLSTAAIAKLGLVRTFQQTKIFRDLTVLEAVMIGHHLHDRTGLFGSFLSSRFARSEKRRKVEAAAEILEFLGLEDRRGTVTQNLPYGEQKLLNVAIALAARPRLLLLDEPAAGLNPKESLRMMDTIRRIKDSGVTVGLVEHNMKLVMSISERIFVLNFGDLIAQGLPEEIKSNEKVIEVYLGTKSRA